MQPIWIRTTLVAFTIIGLGGAAYADEPRTLDPTTLYGSDRVSKIEISIEPRLWNELRLQKRDFTDSMLEPGATAFDNFRANIRIDGVEITDVAIRKKGFFGSVDENFPSLKIKLDEYVDQSPLGASKRLTLNNNKQDMPLISQFMAYRFFNQAGVPAPRVGFANVYVNEKHLGVYSLVETVDKAFLSANFGSSSGDLLEGTLADFSKKSIKRMDHKSGANEDSEKWRVNELAELLQADELDLNKLRQVIEMDSFYRFWATESLLAFWDGYSANQNNFFVYDNPKTGRLHFMPWGADSLWSTMAGPFGGFAKPNESVFANALLANRIFKTEAGCEGYRKTIVDLLAKHWNEEKMKLKIDELAVLLKPHLHDRQKQSVGAQKEMKRFIDSRRQKINRELENWPVKIPDKPRRATYANEIGVASGEFSTFWHRAPKDKESSTKLALRINDKDIVFEEVKVASKRFSMGFMGFGVAPETMPPIVEFNGKSSEGEKFTLTLSFKTSDFAVADEGPKEVTIRGTLNKLGGGQPTGPMGGVKFLQGTCRLTQASMNPGDSVTGQFQVKILRLLGGFFGE